LALLAHDGWALPLPALPPAAELLWRSALCQELFVGRLLAQAGLVPAVSVLLCAHALLKAHVHASADTDVVRAVDFATSDVWSMMRLVERALPHTARDGPALRALASRLGLAQEPA
jgi:hypothetical protein